MVYEIVCLYSLKAFITVCTIRYFINEKAYSNTTKSSFRTPASFYEIKINRSVRNLNSPLCFNRYRGKNYDEMLKENMTNKEYLQRVSRENIMLRGLIRKQGNRVLNRLGEKEAEERHELERAERMRLTKSAKPRLC